MRTQGRMTECEVDPMGAESGHQEWLRGTEDGGAPGELPEKTRLGHGGLSGQGREDECSELSVESLTKCFDPL